MKFVIEKKLTKSGLRGLDALLLPVWLSEKQKIFGGIFDVLPKTDQAFIKSLFKSHELKSGDTRLLKLPAGPGFILLAGEEWWNEKKLALLVRKFVRQAKQEGLKNLGIYLDDYDGSTHSTHPPRQSYGQAGSPQGRDKISAERVGELVAENALMAHFDFSEEFKTKPKGGWKKVEKVSLFTYHEGREVIESVRRGETIGSEVNRCRVLANYPPGDMKPEGLVEAARTIAKENPAIVVTVFDEKRMKAEGMNAILAVGQGSVSPPRLIILEYKGAGPKEKPIALVGKGVTFDSGGLNIKPGESMTDMHMDMSGGAAVLSAVSAIAKLKLPVNVIGLVPAVENMPSGISYRQGDIIKAYGGKTIEIGNTDAEGRVILADAIEYAKTKKPALIITIATLTGSAMGALGLRLSALFVKNNHPLQDKLQELGVRSGDAVWPLPLLDDYDKDVEGNFADITNTHKNNSRYGGAITGASFLWAFAKPANFAHLDMAPRMTTLPDEDQLSRGAAGFGVRYFVELAQRWGEVSKFLK